MLSPYKKKIRNMIKKLLLPYKSPNLARSVITTVNSSTTVPYVKPQAVLQQKVVSPLIK